MKPEPSLGHRPFDPGRVPAQWLRPEWDAPAHVRALMTTRQGGCSEPPFDSMNLGRSVGDQAQAVASNRARLESIVPARLVWMHQVHGDQVLDLTQDTESGAQADACVARLGGVACTIMVADCLPLLFTDEKGSVVAGAHAGWRGLAGRGGCGVVETTRVALREIPAGQLLVWLGPCIGQDAFEVGPEVHQAFTADDPGAHALFRPGRPGKFHADLQGLARRRLARLGVTKIFGNNGSAPWCTHANRSSFFSHRRDHASLGSSGRMAAAIWLD